MNRINPFAILFMGIVTFLMVGCEKEDVVGVDGDVTPVEIIIRVIDAHGNDLLNPNTSGTIFYNKISAIYKDTVYDMDISYLNKSRYYMPYFYGLKWQKSDYIDEYLLYFGEFDGSENYQNEEIIIDWNDGTKDTISFDHTWWQKDISWSETEWTIDVRLNGKKVDYDNVMIDGYWRRTPITIVK